MVFRIRSLDVCLDDLLLICLNPIAIALNYKPEDNGQVDKSLSTDREIC